ncbi:MAG: VanZ family protein [Candidatus Rokubacteria bacterium]|nr:VanZ family protein [Candidatus Rokubacteria bacterium]
MSRRPGRLTRFLPPLAWMAVIALFSSSLFAADQTGSWILPALGRLLPWAGPGLLHALHGALRKLGHVVEYGILAALWLRALGPAPGAAVWAVGLSALYAALDEAHQGLVPNRTASPLDVALDTAGAFVAVAWLHGRGRIGVAGVRLVRWAAGLVAAGSLLAAAIDWALGLAAWDLALAALGAAAVAWGLARLEAGWRAPA